MYSRSFGYNSRAGWVVQIIPLQLAMYVNNDGEPTVVACRLGLCLLG